MSAIRSRRRRGTWMALGAAVLALFAAVALSVVGVATLADSRAGQLASEGVDLPVQRLPYTPTALVGTIDEDRRLADKNCIHGNALLGEKAEVFGNPERRHPSVHRRMANHELTRR